MNEKSNQPIVVPVREQYTAPEIGIIDIETRENILAGSGTTSDMPGEDW